MSVTNESVGTISNDDEEFVTPRTSMQRICRSVSLPVSPLTVISRLSRKSFSYNQLPEEPIRLSVLKLDGSSFEVEVEKTATVDELKQAVAAAFSHMPKKGPGKISWPHVWAHFCLCYDGQKLIKGSDYIRCYGIKDGNQLHFVRHVSITYNLVKKRSKKRVLASRRRKSVSKSNSYSAEEDTSEEDEDLEDIEKRNKEHYCDQEDESSVRQHPSKLVRCLKGWFTYSRLSTGKRSRPGRSKVRPLRLSCCLLGKCRKLLFLFRKKNNLLRDTRSES